MKRGGPLYKALIQKLLCTGEGNAQQLEHLMADIEVVGATPPPVLFIALEKSICSVNTLLL